MDYFVTTKDLLPRSVKDYFSENIVEIPQTTPYLIKTERPLITKTPMLSNEFITFGSFFNPLKINNEVIELWSQVLKKVLSSRLILGNMVGTEMEMEIKKRFTTHNIPSGRISFRQNANYREFLALHNEVDVCLAPFPNSGGTTIASALIMGVPTILLSNSEILTHGGAHLLKSAGCSQFVTKSKREYLKKPMIFQVIPSY